ncbi:MAG: autotransporter outer membrane beta-barrel domain-containing protein [Methyloceanibacter sp.]
MRRAGRAGPAQARHQIAVPQIRCADRKSLLLGTALASTLLLGTLAAPAPANAQLVVCPPFIAASATDSLICNNAVPVTNPAGSAIDLTTTGIGLFIDVDNSGNLTATHPVNAIGIFGNTNAAGSFIDIFNSGDIVATATPGVMGFPTAGILGLAFGPGSFITIVNSGDVTATAGNGNDLNVVGVGGSTFDSDSKVDIVNSGDLTAKAGDGNNVLVVSLGSQTGTPPPPPMGGNPRNPINIVNDGGNLTATAGNGNGARAYGIYGRTFGDSSPINLQNRSGDIVAIVGNGDDGRSAGILSQTGDPMLPGTGSDSSIAIANAADIKATIGDGNDVVAVAIGAQTWGYSSLVNIVNSGGLTVTAGGGNDVRAFGIGAITFAVNGKGYGSPVDILNDGDITVTAGNGDFVSVGGIYSFTAGAESPIGIVNNGDIVTSAGGGYGGRAYAISLRTNGAGSPIDIVNNGNLRSTTGNGTYSQAIGLRVASTNAGSPIDVVNSGDMVATAGNGFTSRAAGIGVGTYYGNPISIRNSGDIVAIIGDGDYALAAGVAGNIYFGPDGSVDIENSGDLFVRAGAGARAIAAGIFGYTNDVNSPIGIVNSGDIVVEVGTGAGAHGIGIFAGAIGPSGLVAIDNSGSTFGGTAGIATFSNTGTTIVNSGYVSAASLLAIDAGGLGPLFGFGRGAAAEILNTGRIVGFVNMTDQNDTFRNQVGGVFETKRVSDFFGGNDLFRNEAGGTVRAATNPGVQERSSFINLNRFESQGLVTLRDGQVGDVFEISNTVGGRDLEFVASGASTLGVDAFLGPPGSTADNLIVNGNVTGTTLVTVNNTNPGPGTFNPTGIPVVYVNGNVSPDAFYLSRPIDTGFFDYDLFFEPTNSGIFVLKNFPGPGAALLPQLVTAPQDIWYLSSSTWFDRTADLRVLLNGGAAPAAYDPALGSQAGPHSASFTPAVWVRGSGSWLDRDKSETVSAFGKTYRFSLDRELDIIDWQMGLDLGHRGLFAPDDILVFGVLGGFVHADLDYQHLVRSFDFSGGQVGGYATYLRGGLFVDTLLNVHLLELETQTLGFPNSLDVSTVGLRTDTGYRFGSFSGGPFIEPLATLLVTWANIESFALGGNRVSFDDDANLRGRLGLRVGTSTPVWGTTVFEPFVIGSLWGSLSDDNQATLTSTGTTFRFEDGHDDIWGEVSLGVNFFNVSAGTAVFAKLDVTFGDDIDGIGGKAGMRVSW